MADHITIKDSTGADKVIATDDATAAHAQLFKLAVSADGSLSLVPADASGVQVQGAAATGAAAAGKPVMVAGWDNTNARTLVTDTSGYLYVRVNDSSGQAAESAPLPSAFVVIAADNGSVTAPLQTNGDNDLKVTLDSESVAVASIAAGDNNIGNVDVVTLPALVAGTANIGDVDVLTMPGTAAEAAALPAVFAVVAGDDGTDTQPLQLSAGGDLKVTLDSEPVAVTGTFWQATQPVSGTVTASNTAGDVAHDTGDSGNPIKVGAKAIAHGANPTAVAADDRTNLYANRHGVLFTMGGHPNVQNFSASYTTTQADVAIVSASAGTKIVLTSLNVMADGGGTGPLDVQIGFATATLGTSDLVLDHPGLVKGSGIVLGNGGGIIGIGADDEDLRIDATGFGAGDELTVTGTYFTIES